MRDLPQPRAARHQQAQFGFGPVGRAVVDVDELEGRARCRAQSTISATSGAMLPASLRTGTTTETVGGDPLVDNSLMVVAGARR